MHENVDPLGPCTKRPAEQSLDDQRLADSRCEDEHVEPTNDKAAVLRALSKVWDRIADKARDVPFKFTVTATKLNEWPRGSTNCSPGKKGKYRGVLDTVRDRFGARELTLGDGADKTGRYTGLKISFEHIPSVETFGWNPFIPRHRGPFRPEGSKVFMNRLLEQTPVGTFQEDPVDVVLRFDEDAAHDARSFLFHPGQTAEWNEDGTLTGSFRAGGTQEMCWHLVTWGQTVTIEKPAELRRRLAEMGQALATHHGPRA